MRKFQFSLRTMVIASILLGFLGWGLSYCAFEFLTGSSGGKGWREGFCAPTVNWGGSLDLNQVAPVLPQASAVRPVRSSVFK